MSEDNELKDRWDAAWNEAEYWVKDNFELHKTNHEIHIMLQKAFLHGVMWQEEQEVNKVISKEFSIYNGEIKVKYNETNQIKNDVFNAIIKWCEEQSCVWGEVLLQSDEEIIDAPVLLSNIIDKIIKFQTIDNED